MTYNDIRCRASMFGHSSSHRQLPSFGEQSAVLRINIGEVAIAIRVALSFVIHSTMTNAECSFPGWLIYYEDARRQGRVTNVLFDKFIRILVQGKVIS